MDGHAGLLEDVDLVAAARTGDPDAFTELYVRHAPAVRRVAAGYVRQPDIVADIVQDTFARALEHLPALREANRFRPWLLSIARHSAVDHGRKSSRESGLDTEAAEALPDREPGPDVSAEVAELARQVSTSIAGLSRRDSSAIAMVTYLGFGPAEVGAALGVSPGAAKVMVHRARRRLRTALSLQLLQAQPNLACVEMQLLLADPDDVIAASRHLDSCERCVEAASDEVVAFDMTDVVAAGGVTGQGPRPEPPPR